MLREGCTGAVGVPMYPTEAGPADADRVKEDGPVQDVERATCVGAHLRAGDDHRRRRTAKLADHRFAAAARSGQVPAGGTVRL